jgi:AcrR family transcriptional regulator
MGGKATAARSRELESEATRRAILDAAEALLASGGEDGLSIRELCARAGVTPPTIYHHFGDKAALVARVVDDCFAEFDRSFTRRAAPGDAVETLRWVFDRYVEYGLQHPAHYRLMFERPRARPTPGGQASYAGLRRRIAAIADAGRLTAPVEDATAAFWSALHGVTALVLRGLWSPDAPCVALVRDAMIAELTRPALHRTPARRRRPRRKEGNRR